MNERDLDQEHKVCFDRWWLVFFVPRYGFHDVGGTCRCCRSLFQISEPARSLADG